MEKTMHAQTQSETPRPRVHLASRPERQSLAKMVIRLFDHWGLTTADRAAALGLSETNRATLSNYRKGEPLGESRDLIERVGHLLGIHKSLRIIFPHDRDLAYRWMTTPNARFGMSPIGVVRQYGFEGLISIRRYLDFERGR